MRANVFDIGFSGTGRRLVSVGSEEGIQLWNVRTRGQMGPALTGHSAVAAAFSPNGRTLASAGE